MTITTNNYEYYFYKYAEGELDAEARSAVEAFAAQHPELAAELACYDPALRLEARPLRYTNKQRLTRHKTKTFVIWHMAAACAAALLIGGAWLLHLDTASPTEREQQGTIALAQVRQTDATQVFTTPVGTDSGNGDISAAAPAIKRPATPTTALAAPEISDPAQQHCPPTPQQEAYDLQTTMTAESSLLAESLPTAASLAETEPPQKDTVILYTDIIINTVIASAEITIEEDETLPGGRFKAFRHRLSNTLRDYAYQAYVETRGEMLAMR